MVLENQLYQSLFVDSTNQLLEEFYLKMKILQGKV